MKILRLCLAVCFLTVSSSAIASWRDAEPLIDGACSIGTVNGNGVIAAAVMDRDHSVRLVIDIKNYSSAMFVINFTNGVDEVFASEAGDNIHLELTPVTLNAFRDSTSFALYKGGEGFITSPFSLAGSSIGIESLHECVEAQTPSARADGVLGSPSVWETLTPMNGSCIATTSNAEGAALLLTSNRNAGFMLRVFAPEGHANHPALGRSGSEFKILIDGSEIASFENADNDGLGGGVSGDMVEQLSSGKTFAIMEADGGVVAKFDIAGISSVANYLARCHPL